MVAIMAAKLREKVAGLLDSTKSSRDLNSKLQSLQHLKNIFSDDVDTDLLSEFLPALVEFHSDSSSPVRKFVIEMVGSVGLKHVEFLPDIVPVLIIALQDSTPAVARQSGTCGIDLFRSTLVRIAIQGIYSSELDDSLKLSWAWMLKFKDEIYTLASEPGSDGRRLVALKFVAATILLYTPDPSGSSEPPSNHSNEEKFDEFNMAWLRRGHPVLDIGDSSTEASKSLDLLLDQLRYSTVKSLNNSAMIVLINRCVFLLASVHMRLCLILFSRVGKHITMFNPERSFYTHQDNWHWDGVFGCSILPVRSADRSGAAF